MEIRRKLLFRFLSSLSLVETDSCIKDQLINAAIFSGFTFFTTLISVTVVDLMSTPSKYLLAGCISAGLAFFVSLIAQRGITVPRAKITVTENK
jgi:hypothetical protein